MIKALDHFNATSQGGQPKASHCPCRLHEPAAKNLHHNLEKLTRRLEAELRGSPPFRRHRTENPGRDAIQEAVADYMAEKDRRGEVE
jgi:hypothetical protein